MTTTERLSGVRFCASIVNAAILSFSFCNFLSPFFYNFSLIFPVSLPIFSLSVGFFLSISSGLVSFSASLGFFSHDPPVAGLVSLSLVSLFFLSFRLIHCFI